MVRGYFYKFSRSFKNLKNVIFHVKLLSSTLKEASSFSSVIDFSSEKYIVVTGQQVLLVPTNEDIVRSRGALSHLTHREPIHDSKLCPKCIVKFIPEDKKV